MITPNRIIWDNYSSVDFDVLTDLAFDGDDGETDTYLGRESIVSEVYDGSLRRGSLYKWSEVFAPRITFIKKNFENFTSDENRRIITWLTSRKAPGYLTVFQDDSEVVSYEVLGNWTNIQQYKYGNGRIIGYVCTFEALMPYAMSPVRTENVQVTSPTTLTINVDSDESQTLIYPKITITQADSPVVNIDSTLGSTFVVDKTAPPGYIPGTVYHYNDMYYWVDSDNILRGRTTNVSGLTTTSVVIENITLGTKTIVNDNVVGEIVTLDGANKVVASSRPSGRIYGDSFNWNWLPLANGENNITITGNCDVKLEYREIRKIGEY